MYFNQIRYSLITYINKYKETEMADSDEKLVLKAEVIKKVL